MQLLHGDGNGNGREWEERCWEKWELKDVVLSMGGNGSGNECCGHAWRISNDVPATGAITFVPFWWQKGDKNAPALTGRKRKNMTSAEQATAGDSAGVDSRHETMEVSSRLPCVLDAKMMQNISVVIVEERGD